MTELKYDPELPFAVQHGDETWARFMVRSDACNYADREGGEVIDTTPKPKIPEDAEFITWEEEGTIVRVAYVEFDYWVFDGVETSIPELIEEIGDAEVTVLVRKEES